MEKFTIPCRNNGVVSTVDVYLGNSADDNNPVQHQAHFLSEQRGIVIPEETMETLQKLKDIAAKNGASFIELVRYAIAESNKNNK